VPIVVAKINDPVRADAYAALGIATICRTSMMEDALGVFLGLPGDPRAGRVHTPTGHHPGPHPVAGAAERMGQALTVSNLES